MEDTTARACPVMTPDEGRYADIDWDVRHALLAKIEAALDEAHATAAARLAAAGISHPPPVHGYFASVAHQALYCRLCGADPHTFEGGDPRVALALIRNAENVAAHHWGADIGRAVDRATRSGADEGEGDAAAG